MAINHELMAAVELASKFYMNELLTGHGQDRDHARGYVAQRRLFRPMVEQFAVGYSPLWSGERPWILGKVHNEDLLIEAGILNRTEAGRLYDPMQGRIVFPQVNPGGKFLGFVGRSFRSGAADKYLSTGSSPIFRRHEVLYRIDRARRSIEMERTVIIVEGLLDAALMFQVGVRNVVATGTKGLSDAQAQLLARYATRLEVMFDNDDHGREGFRDVKRRRAGYFEYVGLRSYPAKYGDPADWVSGQIDKAILRQEAVVTS